jgi:hypothetical protein
MTPIRRTLFAHAARYVLAIVLLAGLSSSATAQNVAMPAATASRPNGGGGVPLGATVIVCATPAGAPVVCPSIPASYATPTPMTVGATYPAGRGVLINCTTAGNVVLTLAAGGNVTLVGLPIGIYVLPFSATAVAASGTTATATYFSLT